MILLALCLAAAPAPTGPLTVRHVEKLLVRTRGRVRLDETLLDAKARLTIASMKDDRPDAVTVDPTKHEFPKARVYEDAGGRVVTFEGGAQPSFNTAAALRHLLGRLVSDDEERSAMSSCTAESQPAMVRWLQQLVARFNGSDPGEVTLSDQKVKCTPTKSGARFDVAFTAQGPRGTLLVTMQLKGTVTVDRSVWFTQWKLAGPVHATGDTADFTTEGALSSSLSLSR